MFELVGFESAKGRPRPGPGRIGMGSTERGNAFLDQLAKVILEGFGELGIIGE